MLVGSRAFVTQIAPRKCFESSRRLVQSWRCNSPASQQVACNPPASLRICGRVHVNPCQATVAATAIVSSAVPPQPCGDPHQSAGRQVAGIIRLHERSRVRGLGGCGCKPLSMVADIGRIGIRRLPTERRAAHPERWWTMMCSRR